MKTCEKLGENAMYQPESAEILGLQVLSWVLAEPEVLAGFLAASGASPGDLAALAREPAFLGALIDHLMEEDSRVLACAAALGVPPTALGAARKALPGGQDPHWT